MEECQKCGVCCIAPDISALNKPLGVRCQYLGADQLCTIYESRPGVCRSYAPWEICDACSGLPLDKAVDKFLRLFGLQK